MSPELERKLVEKHPKLFVDYGAPSNRSLMAFGFECGDGWFDLLNTLCAQLSNLKPVGEDRDLLPLTAIQVKEKYGTLRFYVGACTDEAQALIEFAEAMSAKICDTCGIGDVRAGQAGSRRSAIHVPTNRAMQMQKRNLLEGQICPRFKSGAGS